MLIRCILTVQLFCNQNAKMHILHLINIFPISYFGLSFYVLWFWTRQRFFNLVYIFYISVGVYFTVSIVCINNNNFIEVSNLHPQGDNVLFFICLFLWLFSLIPLYIFFPKTSYFFYSIIFECPGVCRVATRLNWNLARLFNNGIYTYYYYFTANSK